MKNIFEIKKGLIKENGLYPINKNLKDYFEFKKENINKKNFKTLQQEYFRTEYLIRNLNQFNELVLNGDIKKILCVSNIFKFPEGYFFFIYKREGIQNIRFSAKYKDILVYFHNEFKKRGYRELTNKQIEEVLK